MCWKKVFAIYWPYEKQNKIEQCFVHTEIIRSEKDHP